jgi:outer membrane immunogenic protein
MKRTLFAGALAVTVAGPAFAADLPVAPPAQAPAAYVPVAPPVYNWSGVYVGINVGGSWVDQGAPTNTVTSTGFPVGGVSSSSTGFAAGGQAGANFQTGQWVFGIEGDADYLSNKSTVSAADALTGASVQHVYTLDFLSTVRGRVGFAWDRTLFYGTGGLAMGEYSVQRTQLTTPAGGVNPISPAPAGTVETDSNFRLGYAAGGGIEYAVTDNVTLRAEYLFAALQGVTDTFAVSNRTQVAPTEYINVVRGGLNFKFN